MAFEQKILKGYLNDKNDHFKTGEIEFIEDFEGMPLKGKRIPIKISENPRKAGHWFVDFNDWKPSGSKPTKAEHAMHLAASIKQSISKPYAAPPVKTNDEFQDEPKFDPDGIPF